MATPARELAALTREYDAAQRVILERTARTIRARITRMGSTFGANIRKAQLELVLRQIDAMLAGMWTGPTLDTIQAGRKAGAEAAEDAIQTLLRPMYGSLDRATADAVTDGLTLTANNQIERAFARVPRQLSAAVYRNAGKDQKKVHQLIETGLASGLNAREMAKEVYQYVSPTTPGGASYAAMRLSRTEINNAFHNQQRDGAKRIGVKHAIWNLSGSHKVPDECNLYATKRTYEPDAIPDKPHPQCFCYLTYETMSPTQFAKALDAGEFDDELDRRTKTNLARLQQTQESTEPKEVTSTAKRGTPRKRTTAAPKPKKRTVPTNDRIRAAVASGVRGRSEKLSGGVVAETSKVTFKNGTVGVRKHVQGLDAETLQNMRLDGIQIDLIQTPKMMQDAEELASMLARMMGLTAPEVVRVDSDTTVQEFLPGRTAASLPRVFDRDDKFKTFRKYAETDKGVLVGLLDQVIGNDDRNDGNWLIDGDDIVVIDHGLSWNGGSIYNGGDRPISGLDVFNSAYGRQWGDIDIHPDDVDAVREMLTALKPEFDKRGQQEWWAFSMEMVSVIRSHAKGTKRRIP